MQLFYFICCSHLNFYFLQNLMKSLYFLSRLISLFLNLLLFIKMFAKFILITLPNLLDGIVTRCFNLFNKFLQFYIFFSQTSKLKSQIINILLFLFTFLHLPLQFHKLALNLLFFFFCYFVLFHYLLILLMSL
jgi:hypothetical protein